MKDWKAVVGIQCWPTKGDGQGGITTVDTLEESGMVSVYLREAVGTTRWAADFADVDDAVLYATSLANKYEVSVEPMSWRKV